MNLIDFDLSQVYQGSEKYSNLEIRINKQKQLHPVFSEFYKTSYTFREEFFSLLINGGPLMSNDCLEILTNQYFLNKANGDILIFGLGFGWIIFPLLERENISSIKVIEYNQDVISFIEPYILERDIFNKVDIKLGNVEDWYLHENEQFDFIYFDTFETPKDSIKSKDILEPKYKKFLKPGGESYFWCWEIKDLLKELNQL